MKFILEAPLNHCQLINSFQYLLTLENTMRLKIFHFRCRTISARAQQPPLNASLIWGVAQLYSLYQAPNDIRFTLQSLAINEKTQQYLFLNLGEETQRYNYDYWGVVYVQLRQLDIIIFKDCHIFLPDGCYERRL